MRYARFYQTRGSRLLSGFFPVSQTAAPIFLIISVLRIAAEEKKNAAAISLFAKISCWRTSHRIIRIAFQSIRASLVGLTS